MIRLGIIGYGKRIESIVKFSLRNIDPEIRIVGIVDPDEKRARSLLDDCDRDVVFYSDLKEMMSKGKIDALMIGTRCNLHADYGIAASEYEVPLFLEKPVATSMEQATRLENAFEKAKCQVVVSFPLRVSPLCELTRKYLQEGYVGTPEHVTALNYVPYGTCYWTRGADNYKIMQGLFLQKATHDFDYIMYLMGSNITNIAALTSKGRIFGGKKQSGLRCSECGDAYECLESPQSWKRNLSGKIDDHECFFSVDCGTPETGMNEDSSSAIFEFASGAQGIYTQIFYSRRDAAKRGTIISGYKGTLDFDWYRNDLKYINHHAPFSTTVKAAEGQSHFGGDWELAYDFIGMIKGKRKSRTDIWMGIQSVYTCLAAKEAAEKKSFVKVRQVGQ